MTKLSLYDDELPNGGYDTRSLQPVDYGGDPVPEGKHVDIKFAYKL